MVYLSNAKRVKFIRLFKNNFERNFIFLCISLLKALIGFIGLGNMGAHMARNLIKNGHQLIVYDINQKSVSELVKAGKYYILFDFHQN